VTVESDEVEDVWCLSEDVRRTLVANGLTARRCGESVLANRESCNLATIWLPNVRSFEEFREISAILYKVQKAVALLPHPDPATTEIVHRNLRLGQSITGILQATEEQRSWLSPGYEAMRALDHEWSRKLRVRESVRLSVVQPGGTLSILPGVTSGINPAYARYFVRRVRFGAFDPLVEACRAHGYPVVPEVGLDGREDHSRWVVEFPCQVPEGTPLASEMSAVSQLEWVTWAQRNWADQGVSVTVTYRDQEMPEIRHWLEEHYDREVKSVSFLRYSDHGFVLAPYEPIEEAEYATRVARLKPGEFTLVGESTIDDTDCEGGACPVR
jgi:ribonucleoside-diphosphate reductase alpha chain